MAEEEEPEFEIIGASRLEDIPEPFRSMVNSMIEQRSAEDHARMSSDFTQHEFYGWLDELSEDHLRLLSRFAKVIKGDEETGAYFLGYLDSLLQQKFNLCSACHKNHDDDLDKIVKGQ